MGVRIIAVAFAVLLAACSTMDEVEVLHECPGAVEVVVTHRNAIERDGGEQEYWDQTYRREVPSGEITTVAGIVNLYRHDLIQVSVEGSSWDIDLTSHQLRALDRPIEIPLRACR